MSRLISRFDDYVRLVLESDDGGDYISGNDWTMDHDWANYKDHFNDSGSMGFDVEDDDSEPSPVNAEHEEDERADVSRKDLLSMIKDLKSRLEALDTK
jgi:hypothetical protein